MHITLHSSVILQEVIEDFEHIYERKVKSAAEHVLTWGHLQKQQ